MYVCTVRREAGGGEEVRIIVRREGVGVCVVIVPGRPVACCVLLYHVVDHYIHHNPEKNSGWTCISKEKRTEG